MSEQLSHYFWAVFPFVFLIGLLFFLLGLLVGWLIWKSNKSKALEAEQKNKKMRTEYGRLQKELKQLEANA